MELKEMTIEQLEERKQEIASAIDAPEADLDALEAEARAIKEEIEVRKAEEEQRNNIRNAVANGEGVTERKFEKEEKKTMDVNEIRASKEYIDAFAEYIKSGDDKECRALLTTNASGVVPVPVLVDDIVRTAWERNEFTSRPRKTYFRGNLKVAFELSADGAYEHTEGTTAPTEEALTLGIVEMIPKNIKKWITISDEAVTMGGEAFLRYIYDELTYRVIKKLADLCVGDVVAASASNSSSAVGVPVVKAAPSVNVIARAAAYLSDEATNLCVVMNRLTEVDLLDAYASGSFAVDPFKGLPRVYTSALSAYSALSENGVYAIVGDLSAIQVNYPEGEGVVIKYDDMSLAEKDMVKIVGRQYAAHKITAPGRLCKLTKPAS
jgi:HK97 family phage major capsid protein